MNACIWAGGAAMKLRPMRAASRASAGPESAILSSSARAAWRSGAGAVLRCARATSASSATNRRTLSVSDVTSRRPSSAAFCRCDHASARPGSAALRTS